MNSPFDPATNALLLEQFELFKAYFLSANTIVELGVILVLALVAWMLGGRRNSYFSDISVEKYALLSRASTILETISFPLTWLILQWLANFVAHLFAWRDGLLLVTASLLTAWVIIRVASAFIKNPVVGKAIALLAWSIAALNIVGLLDDAIVILDGIGMTFGETRVTLLTLFKGTASLAVLLWASNIVSEYFESRISSTTTLTPSVQVLFSKLFKITLFAIAMLAAISAVGIDLTAFAFLGGAIAVGVGFGLQKIVSNLISGVILLLDRSIKPGDVIAVGESYGRVESLGARYVSVATVDGIEFLIPNEDLIVNRVENWSYSNSLLRLRVGVGVHYKSDVKKAMALVQEAAMETPRILHDPVPKCLLKGFGDSSVDLEATFFIDDPMNGRANVCSDLLVLIWDKFAANDIEIPYPQRDLHLRTPEWEELKAQNGTARQPGTDPD